LSEVVAALAPRVGAAVREGARRLAAAGCETPRLDAELLLAHVLGVDRGRLVVESRVALEMDELARYEALIARRAGREPVAYILGVKEFRRLTLAVDRRVLIPRPETELLVEVALELPAGARVLDIGSGSGAVALAVKDERPDLEVWGTDVDAGAIELARANAGRLGLEVTFVVGDLTAGLSGDAVLANLPYVADAAVLAPEIRNWEPGRALFAGRDGLAVIRRLVSGLDGFSLAALEVGLEQADAVAALLVGAGFAQVERRRDLAGHERVLVGRR
jgi:release factor glutamine methyltransferase